VAQSYWINCYPGHALYPGTGVSPYVNVTQQQWYQYLSKWFVDVDSLNAKQVANGDADWIDTSDGQYWFGTGPGTFSPGSPGTQGAQVTPTSSEGNPSVGP